MNPERRAGSFGGWTGVSDVSFFLTVTFAVAESAGKFPGKNVFDLFSGFGFE